MLWALLVVLLLCAYTSWGWASERKIRVMLTEALRIEKEAYAMLVEHFNEKTVGASFKHKTVRFEQEHTREQAKHPTSRITLVPDPTRKRTGRH